MEKKNEAEIHNMKKNGEDDYEKIGVSVISYYYVIFIKK